MAIHLRCAFDTYYLGDTAIMLIDRSEPFYASVTNDADQGIPWLEQNVDGGIGQRKVYYRDTDGRYDELLVKNGQFDGFKACTASQQTHFRNFYYASPATL